jgi:FkbM family methyltransferase
MLKYAFRDFFRIRRIAKHRARHGDLFSYNGLQVSLPRSVDLGVQNALLRGKYELEEAAMIRKHLPADTPVIELGGSLGVVSTLVRSIIGPAQRHVVVEANPSIAEICRTNAGRYAHEGASELINAAVSYSGNSVRFSISKDLHTSSLAHSDDKRHSIEVPSITLRNLHQRLGAPEEFALVCDIEGAEYEVFENDVETLNKIQIAIVELHPEDYARRGKSMDELMRNCSAAGLGVIDQQGHVYVFGRQQRRSTTM